MLQCNIKHQPKVPTATPFIYRHIPKIGKNGLLDLSRLSVCMQQHGSQRTDFLKVGLHGNAAFCCNSCWWYRYAHLLCKSKQQFSCFSVSLYLLCLNFLLRMEYSAPNRFRYSIPNLFRSLYITVLLTWRRIKTIIVHWYHACAVHTRLHMCTCVTHSTTYI